MTNELLVEAATRLFGDTCTHQAVQAAERDGWAREVWAAASEAGFPWVGVAEEGGGSGGTLTEAADLLRVAGAHAAPIPLAETGVLAGWLLAGAGLAIPSGPATVVPGRREDELVLDGNKVRGRASRVPWGRQAERIVALLPADGGWVVASIPGAAAQIEPDVNLAGEPRDTVTFDGVEAEVAPAAAGVDADGFRQRGALSRALLIAGALGAMSRLTVGYTRQRRQFGKPVASFQAVQQHLVVGAQDAAIVTMAAESAARAAERGDATFEIAAAKTLAGQAAATATRAAHQAHGAMGMTQEYPLHHLSRRLWSWRQEYGDDVFWSGRLGRAVAAAGADQLYPAITGGSHVVTV